VIKLLIILIISCGSIARAADYPSRPIRLVVAYAPGGTTDFAARVTAPKLGELLGQTVVVDNRPGAGSIIGTDLVAKSGPDGHTLLMADTAFGIVPAIYAKLPFNVQKDFSAITQVMSVPNALVVHPSVAARSVREIVEPAKVKPGQLTFGSGGVGTPLHMAGEQLKVAAGINMLHVPLQRRSAGDDQSTGRANHHGISDIDAGDPANQSRQGTRTGRNKRQTRGGAA